jgi:LysR family glycine cleavage system transcriptional activator
MHTSLSLPPMESLMAVLTAAETSSFSAAAETLGLTHGTISRRVQVVEAWLGGPLFERHGRGVRLTSAGRRFVAEVRQALGSISHSAQRWRPAPGPQTVRISVLPSLARLWLVPRLRRLEGKPLDLRIEFILEHRLAELEGGRADLAIRYGGSEWEGVKAKLLMQEVMTPVAAPSVAAKLGTDVDPQQLLRQPLINDSDTTGWRSWFRQFGIQYRPRSWDYRFDDYDLVLAAAGAEIGVALARLPLAKNLIEAGRLIRLSDTEIANPFAHYIVAPEGTPREPVARLIDRLFEALEDPSP